MSKDKQPEILMLLGIACVVAAGALIAVIVRS